MSVTAMMFLIAATTQKKLIYRENPDCNATLLFYNTPKDVHATKTTTHQEALSRSVHKSFTLTLEAGAVSLLLDLAAFCTSQSEITAFSLCLVFTLQLDTDLTFTSLFCQFLLLYGSCGVPQGSIQDTAIFSLLTTPFGSI